MAAALSQPSYADISRGVVRDAPLRSAALLDNFWGGDYTATTGEHVTVYSSPRYAVDNAANQRWADFLASLVHGPELASVRVYLAPPAQVSLVCGGPDVLGCYGNDRLVAP